MPTTEFTRVLSHLRRSLPPPADVTDSLLLERFLASRDESAFAAIVQRHGRMVMGVCNRILGNAHDADDVFQAVFFFLARRARSVLKREALGSWLYIVTYRTALEARTAKSRRQKREVQMTDLPHPEVKPEEARDWLPLLDRELSLLPRKFQTLIVLCDLEGIPRREVARRLRLNEGTLSSRLARARRQLASRLSRYGLTISGGLLGTVLAQNGASAKVPISLVWSTAKAATLIAAGQFAGVSVPAVALMKGAMKTMFLAKLKTTIVTGVVALAIGVGGLVYNAEFLPGGARAADGAKPKSEVDTLRKEIELLKLNLQVTLEKIQAQEAELGKLRAQISKPGEKTANGASRIHLNEINYELLPTAPLSTEFLTPNFVDLNLVQPDPTSEVEVAVKAWQAAKDKDSRQKAAALLEKALQKMKEHPNKVPETNKQPSKP
jgi:RNA polymerase sigma factor (sigma-70 family)